MALHTLNLIPKLQTLTIKNKDAKLERIDLSSGSEYAHIQRTIVKQVEKQYNQGKPVRLIILKGRQMGASTISEALMFWWGFYHYNCNGLVMAHDSKTSRNLFQMNKMFWDLWPFRSAYTLRYATRSQMQWIETGTNLEIATAKNVDTGRGSTFQAIHASECAFYQNPGHLFTGLHEAIPHRHGTIEILESTANGIGNWFYDQWHKSVDDPTNNFYPMFFPWLAHKEYQRPTTLSTRLELDADERRILKFGGSYENVQFRRWKITGYDDPRMFSQEYPLEPEEAFLATGHPVFPRQKVRECYAKVSSVRGLLIKTGRGDSEFIRDDTGPLTIFKMPSSEPRPDLYFVSGDPSGTVGGKFGGTSLDGKGDPACIQVINRATYEQVAVWHGHIDPINFGYEMAKLGRFYHMAELCPEVEGGGTATITALLTMGYPNIWQHRRPDSTTISQATFGWSTNYARKRWACGVLLNMLNGNSVIIHDQKTYEQLLNYVVHENGEWGNEMGGHDDAVMSLAIAVTCSQSEGPVEVYNYPDNFEQYRQEDYANL